MLADVGMVKTYLKSAHVNDLGFAWTGPPCCRRFLHNGARAGGSKVSSVYCTASLPCRRFLVSVLTTVQE